MHTFIIGLAGFSLLWLACSKSLDPGGENASVDEDGILWVENRFTAVDSTVYYVSPAGSDGNRGTGENSAFRTLAHALGQVHPGGTICVLPGTYEECIGLESCGDAAAGIGIKGYNGVPVFDGKNMKPVGLFCERCSHLTFSNIEFRNYTDIGVGGTESTHLTFDSLVVKGNGHAVQLKDWELEGYGIHVEISTDVVIKQCEVAENGPDPQVLPDYIMGTGINTFGNTNVWINGNRSYRNTGGGILIEDSENVLVENNEIFENDLDATADGWWDGGIWLDGGKDVLLRDNLIHDNLGPGIEISDEDRQNPTNYEVRDNISRDNYYGIFIWNFGTTDWPDASIISHSGNQFIDNTVQDIWIEAWM